MSNLLVTVDIKILIKISQNVKTFQSKKSHTQEWTRFALNKKYIIVRIHDIFPRRKFYRKIVSKSSMFASQFLVCKSVFNFW